MGLWKKTSLYIVIFIVVMILNQSFFGFCLKLYCLKEAMPHVLLITALLGYWLNKELGKQNQRDQKPTQKNNNYQQNQQKGEDGEKAFQVFLEAIKIPFTFVDQEPNTKYSNFKRPDFILGYKDNSSKFPIAFEVKNHQTHLDKFGNECHKLEKYELDGLKNFSKDMSIPIYFAFKNGSDWLFISLEQFLEHSFGYKSKFDTHLYRYIHLYHFESGIKNRDDFDNFVNIGMDKKQSNFIT